MPSGTHRSEVKASLEQVQAFIRDPDRWEPLMPGYIKHEIVSARESVWTFKADLGFTKKAVELKLELEEGADPSRVAFRLTGLSDPVEGSGSFEAAAAGAAASLVGSLDISGKGLMAMMMNSVMKEFVPRAVEQLTAATAAAIEERAAG
ncbi:CoxG family protein [Paenibacillus sp. B01]|uniref:CoxG family protein n=1 Tax=Paenibacillus sp. B01 TaxID=2660554 RepID=UPI00129B685F|nr:SRPBCC family protein [Paenibacillus sp. B01]QGG54419.1 SRPBCC family protein [Paenibacillus sp. B01]